MHKTILSLLALVLAFLAIPAQAAERRPAWRLSEASGEVSVESAGLRKAALGGTQLALGDAVVTGRKGRAVIVRGDQYVVVSPNSRLRIAAPERPGALTQIIQTIGSALFKVDRRTDPHFGVDTPFMAAVVKGTRFRVTVGENGTRLEVEEGRVAASTRDGGAEEVVEAGREAFIAADDPLTMQIREPDGERTVRSRFAPPATAAPRPVAAAPAADAPAPRERVAVVRSPEPAATAELDEFADGAAAAREAETIDAVAGRAERFTASRAANADEAVDLALLDADLTPDPAGPVAEAPEAGAPVTEMPEMEMPEAEAPVTETPEMEMPEAEAPVTETPEMEMPEAEAPVTETPEVEAPAVEMPQSEAPDSVDVDVDAPDGEQANNGNGNGNGNAGNNGNANGQNGSGNGNNGNGNAGNNGNANGQNGSGNGNNGNGNGNAGNNGNANGQNGSGNGNNGNGNAPNAGAPTAAELAALIAILRESSRGQSDRGNRNNGRGDDDDD